MGRTSSRLACIYHPRGRPTLNLIACQRPKLLSEHYQFPMYTAAFPTPSYREILMRHHPGMYYSLDLTVHYRPNNHQNRCLVARKRSRRRRHVRRIPLFPQLGDSVNYVAFRQQQKAQEAFSTAGAQSAPPLTTDSREFLTLRNAPRAGSCEISPSQFWLMRFSR